MKTRSMLGFSLMELLVGIVATGIIIAIGVPVMSSVIRGAQITSNANDLVAGIQLARSEAVKRRSTVRLCRTEDSNATAPACGTGTGWESGWVVFVDDGGDGAFTAGVDAVLRRTPAFVDADSAVVAVTAIGGGTVADEIAFDANGFPVAGNVGPGGSGLVFCDNRQSDVSGRVLLIAPTGRPNVRQLADAPFANLSCGS